MRMSAGYDIDRWILIVHYADDQSSIDAPMLVVLMLG